MPICIECSYPVSQLFHVLHSSSKTQKTHAAPPSSIPPPPLLVSPTSSDPAHSPSPQNLPSSLPRRSGEGNERGRRPIINAGGQSGGGGGGEVRLTQCPRCKRFADKYVEHDFVVLFIDLVLVKPQVCSMQLQLLPERS